VITVLSGIGGGKCIDWCYSSLLTYRDRSRHWLRSIHRLASKTRGSTSAIVTARQSLPEFNIDLLTGALHALHPQQPFWPKVGGILSALNFKKLKYF
jgi:hypothetical protein